MKCKIIAPNKKYTGEIAGVPFVNGVAITDNQLTIDYCKNKGYEVEEIKEEVDLNSLKVPELKELAKSKGIDGYENMKKEELIEALKGGK